MPSSSCTRLSNPCFEPVQERKVYSVFYQRIGSVVSSVASADDDLLSWSVTCSATSGKQAKLSRVESLLLNKYTSRLID